MKKFIHSSILILIFGISAQLVAQSVVKGVVLDPELDFPVEGAEVTEENTSNTVFTDADGNFELTTTNPTGTIVISSDEFEPYNLTFDGDTDFGEVTLESSSDTQNLDEVVLIGKGIIDIAKDRETPVAASTIKGDVILEEIGGQDITAAFVDTPSFHLADEAAGFGDGNIRLRGFGHTQIAYLLNGQPINSMEDGRVFFSDYNSISDVTNFVQVQRGLGSSKLAISSVGGSFNIVTKTTDNKQGGVLRATLQNDNYYKVVGAYNTGKMDSGLSLSVLLGHWDSDGYSNGAEGTGQIYFISAGYQPNDRHNFNVLFFGAPQERVSNNARTIEEYLEFGRKFNRSNGTFQGRKFDERTGYSHKPILNLNWDYQINEKSSLSTVLYGTWSISGGTAGQSSPRTERPLRADGTFDYDFLYNQNLLNADLGGATDQTWVLRGRADNYNWYGGIVNFNHEFNKNWALNVGTDARTYNGTHYRYVVDFHGLNSWSDTSNLLDSNTNLPIGQVTRIVTQAYDASPWERTFNKIPRDQRFQEDFSERITYNGLFSQLEYTSDFLSAYVQGSYSTQYHRRSDRYNYGDIEAESERVTNDGYNIKGGANFNFSRVHSAFFNIGHYNSPPFHTRIFASDNNAVNPDLNKNEKSFGIELGYKMRTPLINVDVNLYRTSFKDRVNTNVLLNEDTGEFRTRVNFGQEQVHSGAEVIVTTRKKFHRKITIKGILSLGNWEYKGDRTVQTFDDTNTLIPGSTNTRDVDGGKVGDAPQTSASVKVTYNPIKSLALRTSWKMNANYYANEVIKDNIKLPTWHVFKAGATYKWNLGNKSSLKLSANVNNLFHNIFLSDLNDALPTVDENGDPILDENDVPIPTYDGIRVDSQGRFGRGRTWNVVVAYSF